MKLEFTQDELRTFAQLGVSLHPKYGVPVCRDIGIDGGHRQRPQPLNQIEQKLNLGTFEQTLLQLLSSFSNVQVWKTPPGSDLG